LTFLWDIGLEMGHSVRTIDDCVSEATADITIATALMDARTLAGDETLVKAMLEATGPARIWPSPPFFIAHRPEQAARHAKFDHTAHKLEPNVKEAPGGLRDIQMIGWVMQRHFGPGALDDLVTHGILTDEEFQGLNEGRRFLARVRFALHLLHGRREERL